MKHNRSDIDSRVSAAQAVASRRFQMIKENEVNEVSEKEETLIIEKLDNIEKLLRELVDLNHAALHLIVNEDGVKEK